MIATFYEKISKHYFPFFSKKKMYQITSSKKTSYSRILKKFLVLYTNLTKQSNKFG